MPHLMAFHNASFFLLLLFSPLGCILEGCEWCREELGALDFLCPHGGLLLVGVLHVLHLGDGTLLVVDTFFLLTH